MVQPYIISELIEDLYFLSNIETDFLILLPDRKYQNTKNWIGWIYRQFFPGQHEILIKFLNGVVERCFDIMSNKNHAEYYIILKNHIIQAQQGLTKLTQTYLNKEDYITSNKIKTLSESLNLLY